MDKDSIMAIILSGFFGLGTILISILKRNSSNLISGVSDIFYGNVSAISSYDLFFILCFSFYFISNLLFFTSLLDFFFF